MSEYCTDTINKTVASVLEGGNSSETIPSCVTLETYKETHIFIPVDITEEVIELVARKLLGGSGLGGTGSESLQVCIMKFGEDITRLHTNVETFVEWLANGSLHWGEYCAFMPGRQIAPDKNPGVCPVGVGETWRRIFANIGIKVTVP